MYFDSYPGFFPFAVASNYIQKWTCDIENKTQNRLYFKYLSGEGEVQLATSCKYKGHIENGFFEGAGSFFWPNGVKYKGDFKESKITGRGKFVWPDGSLYQGQVHDGKREGEGTFYCVSDKYIYTGQWKDGLKEGLGKIQYKDQSIYEGHFHKDRRQGYGKMMYSSKNQYQGMWNNDKKEGKGTMNWVNSHEKYTGEWKQDLPHGYGEYFWYENKTEFKTFKNAYKGFWKQGKRSGFGSFYYSNGYRFEGFFSQNLKEGLGLIIDDNGFSKLQQYSCDRPLELKQIHKQKIEARSNKEAEASQKKFPLLSSKNHSKHDSSINQSKYLEISDNFKWQNQYQKFIDFDHSQANEIFFNLLLRYNSKLRNLYKCIGVSNNQLKDFYSGMVLENYWKALRECKLLSQNYSLASVDRQLSKGNKYYFDVGLPDPSILGILQKERYDEKILNYSEIPWHDYFQKLNVKTILNWHNMVLNFSNTQLLLPPSCSVDIHHSSNIVLYRQFICLVVHTALLIDDSKRPLKQKVQLFINSLEHFNDPSFKQKCQDSCTQAGSGKAIIVPEWVKVIHEELVHQIEPKAKNFEGKFDLTIPVRKLYSVLERGNIFKDLNEKILYLERIERYLNIKSSPLKKQHRNVFFEVEKCIKWNQNFGYLMNYQMNLKQIHEFMFLCINKKFVATTQEEFEAKYKEVVKVLVREVRECKNNAASNSRLKNKRKESEKDRMKQQLMERMEENKLKLIEEQKRKKEEEQQRRERELMALEDCDAEQIMLENESDDYYT